MVGVGGFEPPTPCSRSRCASRAALHPDIEEGLGEGNGLPVDCRSPFIEKMVGVTGFEPATTSTPRKCASRAAPHPDPILSEGLMVSYAGFEPATSSSGDWRSIQLS